MSAFMTIGHSFREIISIGQCTGWRVIANIPYRLQIFEAGSIIEIGDRCCLKLRYEFTVHFTTVEYWMLHFSGVRNIETGAWNDHDTLTLWHLHRYVPYPKHICMGYGRRYNTQLHIQTYRNVNVLPLVACNTICNAFRARFVKQKDVEVKSSSPAAGTPLLTPILK